MARDGAEEMPEGEAATWTVVRQLSEESPEHLGHAAIAGSVLALCQRIGVLSDRVVALGAVVDRRGAEIGAVLHGLLKQSRASHQLQSDLAQGVVPEEHKEQSKA